MNQSVVCSGIFSPFQVHRPAPGRPLLRALLVSSVLAAFLPSASSSAQVVTIDRNGNATAGNHAATVDRRFAQIEPTKVELSNSELDPKTRIEVIRIMEAEQGFAMRPFPKGHKGLTLVANGKLDPAGESYLDVITKEGTSAKPGDRVVLTDVKIEKSKIIFSLNGGPDHKHSILRHIQIGTGTSMGPVVQGDDADPVGARLTLEFKDHIPELTGSQVKALLAPLISFDVKTPIQAFTDTLPPQLKQAILNHHVIVGMSTEMVMFAKGQPDHKTREMDGQMPFEEWIYGKPPKDIEFVRINGNRVIRVEIAKVGEAPEIFTKDEVEGMMRTDGSPLAPPPTTARTVEMGDTPAHDPNTHAPDAPPSLRKDGETLPQDSPQTGGAPNASRPVQFPKQKADDYPDATNLPRDPKPADDSDATAKPDDASPDASKPAQPSTSQQPPPN
jgi:hypothetical protein